MRLWAGYRWIEYEPPLVVTVADMYDGVLDESSIRHVTVTQNEDCPACDAPAGEECSINPAYGTLYDICQHRMDSWTDVGFDSYSMDLVDGKVEATKLSGVTLRRIEVEGIDPDRFIDDLVQTAASLCPGVEYADEDHAKGLPDE